MWAFIVQLPLSNLLLDCLHGFSLLMVIILGLMALKDYQDVAQLRAFAATPLEDAATSSFPSYKEAA